jgi:hypothetical protein
LRRYARSNCRAGGRAREQPGFLAGDRLYQILNALYLVPLTTEHVDCIVVQTHADDLLDHAIPQTAHKDGRGTLCGIAAPEEQHIRLAFLQAARQRVYRHLPIDDIDVAAFAKEPFEAVAEHGLVGDNEKPGHL